MKTSLIVIGKTDNKHMAELIDIYSSRITKYMPFNIITIPDIKNAKNKSFKEIKLAEGKLLLDKIKPSDSLVLLDDKGEDFSSIGFSKFINKQMISGVKHQYYIVGGAYGFSDEVYQRANNKVSLSKMTFSHQMVRLIFTEQLYRACTILKNEPYHHE